MLFHKSWFWEKSSFMENIVLSFGMVAVVVVDADSKFLNVFKSMCEILKITLFFYCDGFLVTYSMRTTNRRSQIVAAPSKKHANFCFLFHF